MSWYARLQVLLLLFSLQRYDRDTINAKEALVGP